jgi:flagellar hook assembly protein FlgD
MIDATTASRSLTGLAETTLVRNPGAELDKTDFLTLMITQLRNQDPLEPLDQNAFLTQTAQFSALEQLVNINQTLDGLATTLAPLGEPAASLAQLQQIAAALGDIKTLLAGRDPAGGAVDAAAAPEEGAGA